MAFTAAPAPAVSRFTGRPLSIGPSPVYAADSDQDLRDAAAVLLGEMVAGDRPHTSTGRACLLQGALHCLGELEARDLWPARIAALDDAAETALERGQRL